MASFFAQNLAFYNDENSPNSIEDEFFAEYYKKS